MNENEKKPALLSDEEVRYYTEAINRGMGLPFDVLGPRAGTPKLQPEELVDVLNGHADNIKSYEGHETAVLLRAAAREVEYLNTTVTKLRQRLEQESK